MTNKWKNTFLKKRKRKNNSICQNKTTKDGLSSRPSFFISLKKNRQCLKFLPESTNLFYQASPNKDWMLRKLKNGKWQSLDIAIM